VSLFFDCHDSFYQESFPVFLVPVGMDEDDVVAIVFVYTVSMFADRKDFIINPVTTCPSDLITTRI
jgi:hypothetical protein